MKKIINIFALAILTASPLCAQTMGDALVYGKNNYYGTARTLGMGNAVTAVGGDLGAISIQPAAGSVAGYSQVEFSLGTVTSVNQTRFAPSYNTVSGSQTFGTKSSQSKTVFTLPNMGVNIRFNNGGGSAVRSFNYGFVVNRTESYRDYFLAKGIESNTSITGAFATGAAGMPGNIGTLSNPYDQGYFANSVAAYLGGLINYNYNGDADEYYGSGELKELNSSTGAYDYRVPGNLYQQMSISQKGSKNEYVFNIGMNIADRVFLGFNLGIPAISNKFTEYFRESTGDNWELFKVTPEYVDSETGQSYTGDETYYLGSTYRYEHNISGTGINAKFGIIALPTNGLRIGASIYTPTAYTIHDKYGVRAAANFDDSRYSASSTSPVWEDKYDYRSPWGFDLGLAYTFGPMGMISIDYGLTDFSVMKYSYDDEEGDFADDSFYRVNQLNKLFCGVQHQLRIGAEVKPLPFLAIRAGFNLTTSPERTYKDMDGYLVNATEYDLYFDQFDSGIYSLDENTKKYSKDRVWSGSIGLGYISAGAFYGDVAVRRTVYAKYNYSPYSAYVPDYSSPAAEIRRSVVDAVFTFGWRF